MGSLQEQITKKIKLFFISIGLTTSLLCYSQGSGNELLFDGVDDITMGNSASLNTYVNNFTMEMWIKPSAAITVKTQQNGLSDISGTTGNGQRYLIGPTWGGASDAGAGISAGTNAIQVYEHGAGYMPALLVYSTALPNDWVHIAVVYTAKQPKLYLNGVLVKTGLTSNRTNVYPSASIGGFVYGYYQGRVDEFRIWSTSRTQTQIRDNMCLKLVGNEANLVRYYRFDEPASSTTASDASGNQNAALQNMATATCWVTSGAAIGDASIYNYPASWATVSISLSSTAKGDFQVNTVTGNPSGIQVYRVDAAPSLTTGLTGLGGNNTYFGTYVVGGAAPAYNAVFNYTSYPSAMQDEANLFLFTRGNNSVATWTTTSATLNLATHQFTKTGITTRAEYILVNPTSPLPIELLYFTGKCDHSAINFSWATETETDNSYFIILQSVNGTDWRDVAHIKGNGTSLSKKEYNFTLDAESKDAENYYVLAQVDGNGQQKFASDIIEVNCSDFDLSIYPNPAHSELNIKGIPSHQTFSYVIYDNIGKVVKKSNNVSTELNLINVSDLPKAIYHVEIISGDKLFHQKLIVN